MNSKDHSINNMNNIKNNIKNNLKINLTITCPNCKSAIHIYPNQNVSNAKCDICSQVVFVKFSKSDEDGILSNCPHCHNHDFYAQKDFSRAVGISLFILASFLSIWTYGLSFVVLYLCDYFLFQKLGVIAICYHCDTIFRNVANIDDIDSFDHEKNDRIKYAK